MARLWKIFHPDRKHPLKPKWSSGNPGLMGRGDSVRLSSGRQPSGGRLLCILPADMLRHRRTALLTFQSQTRKPRDGVVGIAWIAILRRPTDAHEFAHESFFTIASDLQCGPRMREFSFRFTTPEADPSFEYALAFELSSFAGQFQLGSVRLESQIVETRNLLELDAVSSEEPDNPAAGQGSLRIGSGTTGIDCLLDGCDGRVDEPRAPRVSGWIRPSDGESPCLRLQAMVNGVPIGESRADRLRPDLVEEEGSIACGFHFRIPHRFCDGRDLVIDINESQSGRPAFSPIDCSIDGTRIWTETLSLRNVINDLKQQVTELERTLPQVENVQTFHINDWHAYFQRQYVDLLPSVEQVRDRIEACEHRPLLSVVIPAYNPNLRYLGEAIRSVQGQTYGHWELCISDDGSSDEAGRQLIRDYARSDTRIRFTFASENAGIAANTNRAAEMAEGDWILFLDQDDHLHRDALFWMVEAMNDHPGWRLIYSDEDRFDDQGNHFSPNLKPDWNYDLLLRINYICHLVAIQRDLFTEIGGLRDGFHGAQDRELILRASEQLDRREIGHIHRIAYHWRHNPDSVSTDPASRDTILANACAAVNEHLKRTGQDAAAEPAYPEIFANRINRRLPDPAPSVTIIIPTKNHLDLLQPCVESVLNKTTYPNFEILIVDHESDDGETRPWIDDCVAQHDNVRVIEYTGAFNYSAINNFAVDQCDSEFICLLNNDTTVIEPDWLSLMVAEGVREGVGAVGAKLLYPDGTVQHAGVVIGLGGVAGHEHAGISQDSQGHNGLAVLTREVTAVTGACLLVRKTLFEDCGGLDSGKLAVSFNDVSFCLSLRKAGAISILSADTLLYHHESKSRGFDILGSRHERMQNEIRYFRKNWNPLEIRESYYNHHWDLSSPTHTHVALHQVRDSRNSEVAGRSSTPYLS